MKKIYRRSHHKIHLTKSKQVKLNLLFAQYKSYVQTLIDFIWDKGHKEFNVKEDELQLPKFLDVSFLSQFPTELGGMLRQNAGLKALQMLKSSTEKQRKRLYVLGKLKEKEKPDEKEINRLIKAIKKNKPLKPNLNNLVIEISRPDVVKDIKPSKHFHEFLKLSFAGNVGTIKIPYNFHKHSRDLELKGAKRISSAIRIYEDKTIDLIWELEQKETNGTKIVGCDQGKITCASMSDGQFTVMNKHGQDLNTILHKLSKKKKGSINFSKAQEHRKNYVNWSINQLNFDDVKEINFERVKNLRKFKRTNRLMQAWKYTLIKKKLKSVSEEKGFQFNEVHNKFRSQRCYSCGYVNKGNRKKSLFKCKHCSYESDADLNAALNLSLKLEKVPEKVFHQKLNRKSGFFWMMGGVYDARENIIPLTK